MRWNARLVCEMNTERLKLSPTLQKVITIAVQALIPFLMLLGSIRLIMDTAEIWVPIEYKLPGFPEDRYGFTYDDRVYWSGVDIEFLLSDADIEYFNDFVLDSGEPMHNERELKHMEDVKVLVDQSWLAFRIGVFSLVILLAMLDLSAGLSAVWDALRGGVIWTLILLAVTAVVILFAFGFLFVGFHQIFFEEGTWTFLFSDTFIRLYPQRFWRDVFIFVVILTLIQAGILYLITILGSKVSSRNKGSKG